MSHSRSDLDKSAPAARGPLACALALLFLSSCASGPSPTTAVDADDEVRVTFFNRSNELSIWSRGNGDPAEVYSSGRNTRVKFTDDERLQQLLQVLDDAGTFDAPPGAPPPADRVGTDRIVVERGGVPEPWAIYLTPQNLAEFSRCRDAFLQLFNSTDALHTSTDFGEQLDELMDRANQRERPRRDGTVPR